MFEPKLPLNKQQTKTSIALTTGSQKCRKCYATGCNNATTFISSLCQNLTCGKLHLNAFFKKPTSRRMCKNTQALEFGHKKRSITQGVL